jgi:predicted acetyltransferase/predicted enzyme related to lactoylglutathione lyase
MSGQLMQLVWPAAQYLPSYIHALQQGWSPDNLRPEAAQEQLARIAASPDRFLAEQVDREAKGPPVILPDGRQVLRLPGYSQWMWDGEFCGLINFRWQPGSTDLPPYCLGHIGYSVVPWKRRLGYATRALRLLLKQAVKEGLPFVQIVADADNVPSQRVIETNWGKVIERFDKYGTPGLRTASRSLISLMSKKSKHGVVIFTEDVERLSKFYQHVTGLMVQVSDEKHTVLACDSFELVIHALGSEPKVGGPPRAREDSYIKPFFPVASLAETRKQAAEYGGQLRPARDEWSARGFRACEAIDPDGNVIQFREEAE